MRLKFRTGRKIGSAPEIRDELADGDATGGPVVNARIVQAAGQDIACLVHCAGCSAIQIRVGIISGARFLQRFLRGQRTVIRRRDLRMILQCNFFRSGQIQNQRRDCWFHQPNSLLANNKPTVSIKIIRFI